MYNIKTETTILSFSPTGSVIMRPFTMLSHISISTAGGVGISCLASANKAQLEAHEKSAYWCASDFFRYRCLWDEGRWALSNIWKITNTQAFLSQNRTTGLNASPALPTLTRGPLVGSYRHYLDGTRYEWGFSWIHGYRFMTKPLKSVRLQRD